MTRPARVIVNVSAVRANFKVVQAYAPRTRVMAIVKADAYGHGIARIAGALERQADAFGVASLDEALALRNAGIEGSIVLLEGPFAADEVGEIVANGFETVVHTQAQLRPLSEAKADIPLWVKIDTGMHRLGFPPPDVDAVVRRLRGTHRPIRFMTHLASAHHETDASVTEQLRVFGSAVAAHGGERSIANSGAVLAWPACHADWVRPGLMLYGVSPFQGSRGADYGLRPAMTVASNLIAVREVEVGGSVGYGKGYVCPERMRVGVVAFGYGDGYPRQAATGTPIDVAGVRTQVIGEASMDMLTVDLRPVPQAAVGDPVVLWGPDLPVEEVAISAQTIPYELLCRVRMRARYVESE
ncbi:MAG: alanine racemase [Gammaproteobacteria bacterium]|nr:alanine racemase [Gammaproteobacteria bacterium]HJP36922.1 alanine racemase [Gammaproteobacteria bacterium]